MTTQIEKGREKYIPLQSAKASRGRKAPGAVVRQGEVYLSNDKSERKATGSYYTPDPIVEYIVEHTVGPVLHEKLEALRPHFRKVRKTFDREQEKATAYPVKKADGTTWDPREFAEAATYTAHKDLVETLFDFRVLDPAMGSGHFLVEGVDFITDRLLTFLNSFPINPVSFALKRTRENIKAALNEQGVSVEVKKLTEINLLKRHVLKRCIYGVDLNPMAVELAKVSLWLDAFTLGAPLSFLDHHLRCGNSLIGATFKDLEATVKSTSKRAGSLFGINYEPLLRAIQHVLFVNKMADATAAEVQQSSSEYDRAREDLSGYQVVLDLLVAKHFGFPKAPELLTHATAGAFRKFGNPQRNGWGLWHYSGSLYWFRNRDAFRRNWRYVPERFYGTEAWPGIMFAPDESACVVCDDVGDLYNLDYFEKHIEPQLAAWRATCSR